MDIDPKISTVELVLYDSLARLVKFDMSVMTDTAVAGRRILEITSSIE